MKAKRTTTWLVAGLVLAGGLALLAANTTYAQPATTTPAVDTTTADAQKTVSADATDKNTEDPPAGYKEAWATDRPGIPFLWYVGLACSLVALFMAKKYYKEVRESDEGDPSMIKIASYVREGAMAYLTRQYKVVAVVFVILIALLAWMAYGLHVQHGIVPFAFLTGGFFSGLCGYIGMKTATMAAHRTTAGAREGLNRGLRVAFRAGAVMGLVVVGFAVLDVTVWFLALYIFAPEMPLFEITVVMLTFGMGASTQALFARVGGGIYTKAADVGADLVGKVEAEIPEDDPRNPAAIADNVGDNVGDVAGMGADLYESYAGSILATSALGVAAALSLGHDMTWGYEAIRFLSVPVIVAGLGILSSIWLGIELVKTEEGATMAQLMGALNKGLLASSVGVAAAAFIASWACLSGIEGVSWSGIAWSVVVGLVAGFGIGKFTEIYTSYDYEPTKRVASQGETGPATVIISGIAEGMKSTWAALAIIIVAILLAFNLAGGGDNFMLGLYGVGLAAVGMLATLGFTLATDAYGPVADNAGGNAEMTGQKPEVRERTDALDSLGNTTAAVGKGFAIGSAALTALALLAAYVEEVRIGQIREARAFVAQVDESAVTNGGEDKLVGDIYYIGYGKFAQKYQAGTGDSAFDGFMLLNEKERPVIDQMLEDQDQKYLMISGLVGGDRVKNDNVFTTTVTDKAGTSHELKLVRSRKASLQQFMDFYDVTLMNPKVLCGMFAGVMLAFVFCALTMNAVGRAAYKMMLECREQFKRVGKYLMDVKGMTAEQAADSENWPREQVEHEGQKVPDYASCVAISTAGAQKEMVFPSLLAIAVPILVGLLFGVPGVMGLLAGGLTSGFAVAIFMANAGGAWDNAKKYVEKGNFGGKGSEAHKATIVGDTVGDPFKDTSGPSLNILIKLMSMVSVVFAGLIVAWAPRIAQILGI